MGNEIFLLEQCPTGSCGYGVRGGGGDCDGGNSSCANGRLVPPDFTSGDEPYGGGPAAPDSILGGEFDAGMAAPDVAFGGESDALKNATQRINDRLAGLGPGPEGHKLSFLRTPIGIAVGWIRHPPNAEQQPPNPDYVRAEDPRVVDELMIDRRVSPGDNSAAGTWDYQITDNGIICTPGPVANCWIGPFLVADTNAPYHPPAVREVVEFIIDELNQLDKDANGRKIALIKRGGGMMLAWVMQQSQPASMSV